VKWHPFPAGHVWRLASSAGFQILENGVAGGGSVAKFLTTPIGCLQPVRNPFLQGRWTPRA